jgi:hypothetical protein
MMSPEQSNRASGAAIGFVSAVVFFVVLTAIVRFCINVPPVDIDRGAERAKALATIRANEEKSLTTVGWADQSRGIVRLPIDQAIQQSAAAWQANGPQARADLNARADKAAAPAPVAPPKPSAFE